MLSSSLLLLLLSLLFYYCYYYYLRLIQLRPCITHAYQAKELQKKCCYLSLASKLPQFDLMAHGRLAKQKRTENDEKISLGGLPELWKTLIGFVPVPFKIMSNIQLSLNQTNHLPLVFDRPGLKASYFISFLFVS